MSIADQIAGPEGDLLDLHRLLTGQWPTQGTHPEHQALRRAWQHSANLHEALVRRASEGFRGVIVLSETLLFEALKTSGAPIPALIPIVPNIQGLMRDAVEHGMVGAGMRRALRAGPMALAGMGLRNLGNIGAIKRGDFPTLMRGLIELDLAGFAKHHCPAFLLQPQMTDLAVAANNPRIVETFVASIRTRSGAAAGVITHNATATVSALKTWGIEVAMLVTPFGSEPGMARPDNETAAHALKAAGLAVWAERRLAASPPTALDRSAFKRAGMLGACRDDLALWLHA